MFYYKLNVYNIQGDKSFEDMRVYAVGIFVTKYKYNNAWLNNQLSDADLINFHVILSLITTR